MAGRSDTAAVYPINSGIAHYIAVIAYATILVAFLSAWHWKTTGNLSGSAVATFVALSSAALIYGRHVTDRLPQVRLGPRARPSTR
jgi:hypothetical protein